MVAAYQAEHAEDPKVRAAFHRIAEDELRHAALSHRIDAWLATQLTTSQRAAAASARRETFVELRRAAMHAPSDEVARIAGWPRPTQALALADSLREGLLA